MLFKKDGENLSVEILDMKIDTSKILNIKEAKLVHINGKSKLVNVTGKLEFDYTYRTPCLISLNDIPIAQAKIPSCPTCCSILATGYGIENANCQELLDIQEKINSDYISLEKSIENMEPLLTLFETGFYLIADAICYPTDGNKNFFWNIPNKPVEIRATGAASFLGEDNYPEYIYGQPVYLYPTQTTDSYDENRVKYYIDKFNNLGNNSPRAIVYNFSNFDFMNFVIDGHHKACASALLGEPLRCLLIIPSYIQKYPKETILYFSSSININKKNLPDKYSSLVKETKYIASEKKIRIKNGIVNKRKWEKEYLESVKKYISQNDYGRIIDILMNGKIEITNELIEYCLKNFDKDSQQKMEKIIYLSMLSDMEKAQEISLKYAKNSLRYEIDESLREFIYKILANIKDNDEVEQIFVDYCTYYSENKEDPVIEIINSYWKN